MNSRSGLIALFASSGARVSQAGRHSRKLDEEKQKAFIESYNKLLNSLTDNEAVVFADAVASNPCRAARRLLGAEPGEARD